ncbi:MAG TPA: mannose-1-phosphate guanylyltransferase [Amycolatopsis sp.]|nr:mannose-1-phosphate guanylyltransferase [Amycolatopsis sp.]
MRSPDDLYAVVPAGGSGTRLWPLSRAAHPKFFQPLTGTSRSLLQATFDRLRPLVEPERICVVTGVDHAAGVARQLPEVPEHNIMVEPAPRDSCAAIALAAAVIERRRPGALMASFAADHLIQDEDAFRHTVLTAAAGAADGLLMTVGIMPTRPETGYGYVQCSEKVRPSTVQPVLKYREKPPLDVAKQFVESGKYLWNAGMFIWRTDVFLARLAEYRPDIAKLIQEIAAVWDTPRAAEVLGRIWPTVPRIAVEYAVMEPAAADGLVGTVPGDFGWSDIGDFETVATLLGTAESGSTVVDLSGQPASGPSVVGLDSDNLVVLPRPGKLVAALDVHDLIVVDTEDALLLCRRDRAQDIKKLIELLRERGAEAHI